MQCFGVRRPSRRLSRSRELYLQEQSLKVAALNGQRLGKGFKGPEIRGGWEGSWSRTQTVCLGAWTCLVLLRVYASQWGCFCRAAMSCEYWGDW